MVYWGKDAGKLLDALPEPRSGWLLKGDSAAYPDRPQLRRYFRQYRLGRPGIWTTCERAEVGDLLFVYFLAPTKAITHVTRAVSRPFASRDLAVSSETEVSRFQWWIEIGPMVEVSPISYGELSKIMGAAPNLRGRSGVYLSTGESNGLLDIASAEYCPRAELIPKVMRTVIGRDELPDPKSMTLDQWAGMPSSVLKYEREVEQHVVEPLIRLCGVDRQVEVLRQHRLKGGITDYALFRDGEPTCVIEVKKRIDTHRDGRVMKTSSYEQLFRYTSVLGCHGALIDCDQVLLFDPSGEPCGSFERRLMEPSSLASIAACLNGGRS